MKRSESTVRWVPKVAMASMATGVFTARRASMMQRLAAVPVLAGIVALAGCAGAPPRGAPQGEGDFRPAPATAQAGNAPAAQRPGAYYQDDGPGDAIPSGLEFLPDAFPRVEPYSRTANRPYVVFGQEYRPDVSDQPFVQRGMGSWYGRKFHGQRTSSGEIYDMYRMTAAHPTLPIPSFVLVTNTVNGRSVIVRVNDRGPFLRERVIDLSFAAAYKLGYVMQGSAPLQVERILPVDIAAGRIPLTTTTLARTTVPAAGDPVTARAAPAPALVPVVAMPADVNAVAVAAPVRSADPVVATPLASAPAAVAGPADAPARSAAPAAPATPLVTAQAATPTAAPASVRPAVAASATPAGAAAPTPVTGVPAAALPAALQTAPAAAAAAGVDAPILGAFVLQLGAFRTVVGAEALRAQLIARLASLKGRLRIVPGDDFYRVQVGPYPDRRAAVTAAEAMAPALRFTPLVVQRR